MDHAIGWRKRLKCWFNLKPILSRFWKRRPRTDQLLHHKYHIMIKSLLWTIQSINHRYQARKHCWWTQHNSRLSVWIRSRNCDQTRFKLTIHLRKISCVTFVTLRLPNRHESDTRVVDIGSAFTVRADFTFLRFYEGGQTLKNTILMISFPACYRHMALKRFSG